MIMQDNTKHYQIMLDHDNVFFELAGPKINIKDIM